MVSGVLGRSGYGFEENKLQYIGLLGGLIFGLFVYLVCCYWGPISGGSSSGKRDSKSKGKFEMIDGSKKSNVREL